MKFYGLIGFPLTHSFSKQYFEQKFRDENITSCKYELIPLKNPDNFIDISKSGKYSGFNVTIPYKQSIIKFLDYLDETARQINAVNVIKVEGDVLKGFNTDVTGFENSLKTVLREHHKKALILGTGGSSKAAGFVLNKLGIETVFVSGKPVNNTSISYSDITIQIIETYKLIINCTPLGMFPEVDTFPPLPYEFLSSSHLLYDLIYNPVLTKFLQLGLEKGATIKNGLEMFQIQAEESWRIWNGER